MSASNPEPQETECAICFDATAESVALPCSCRIAYCGGCWDRALVHSYKACGQARCPSCRGPVRVDFDPAAAGGRGRLVFSREARGSGRGQRADKAETLGQIAQRLAEQALPAQVRLLEHFGAAWPNLREIAQNPQEGLAYSSTDDLVSLLEELGGSAEGCSKKADIVAALESAAGGARRLAMRWAAVEGAAPECVCGGALVHVDGRARVRQFVKSTRPDLAEGSGQFDAALAHAMADDTCGRGIICDLCEGRALKLTSSIWTCGRGCETVLHARSYDVCEDCFLRHALGHSPSL